MADRIVTALTDRRRELGWNQRQVAEEAGTAQSAVCAWETGSKQPNLPSLHRWAGALGMAVTLVPIEEVTGRAST